MKTETNYVWLYRRSDIGRKYFLQHQEHYRLLSLSNFTQKEVGLVTSSLCSLQRQPLPFSCTQMHLLITFCLLYTSISFVIMCPTKWTFCSVNDTTLRNNGKCGEMSGQSCMQPGQISHTQQFDCNIRWTFYHLDRIFASALPTEKSFKLFFSGIISEFEWTKFNLLYFSATKLEEIFFC